MASPSPSPATRESEAPAPAGRETVIQLADVCKTYPMDGGEVRVLRNIDISVERGEYVAIMGPSGSGKSTLLNLLGCLDVPTSGRYVLNGRDVSRLSRNELARVRNRDVGFIFQNFNLLPRTTALRNVEIPMIYARVPRAERRERAKELLRFVGLANRMHHRPSQLSGGQKQRVAIARALVNDPALVLADEPTGNIDSLTGEKIMALLADLHRRGQTILLVTHDPAVAREADRVIEVHDGTVRRDQKVR